MIEIDDYYRPIPFWSWNDKLEPETLKWQIEEMKKAGLGGYFMHARGGLETEYLSDDWMKCIETGIETGKKEKIGAWIYDEDGWPSGFAGGLVTAMGDSFHARGLVFEEVKELENVDKTDDLIGIYSLDKVSNIINLISLDILKTNKDKNITFYKVKHISDPCYIDVMDETVVKAFIDVTHEKYYKLFGNEFGKGLLGFFTDEPRLSVGNFPWSYIFKDKFVEAYGYDVTEMLPALIINCEGYEKVRYDFWKLVNGLFVQSFIKQIGQWCENHDCELTGHIMMEESVYSQMTGTAGVMPFYEYMSMPGMDWLRRSIGSPVVPKQVSSVANQLGKKSVLTETFALCGWNISFEELKWMAEWQYVNGVNVICQHLEAYTLRGLRKRDYPPSLFYQQSWWSEYKLLNDYFARLGTILSCGENVAKILVIHPIASGWVTFDGTNNDKIKKIDEDFTKISEILSASHVDYQYGDETIIAKHGSVNEKCFKVGNNYYEAVVLPSMYTISGSTIELLEQFISNGGTVISAGEMPHSIDGKSDIRTDDISKKILHVNENTDEIYKLLNKCSLSEFSISVGGKEVSHIHYQQRKLEEGNLYFMVNHHQKENFITNVSVKGKGRFRKVDMNTGDIEEVPYYNEGEATRLELEFLPMQSHIIIFDNEISEKEEGVILKEVIIEPKSEWTVEKMDLNSLTLDYCSYSIDNGQWQEPIPIIKLMDMLIKLRRSFDIALKFNFNMEIEHRNCREMYVVIEKAEEFDIYVNGKLVACKTGDWWKDLEFKKVWIKEHVKLGENEIVLKRKFYQAQKVYDVVLGENVYETEKNKLTYDVELESIYIIGDFGVRSSKEYVHGERNTLYTDGSFSIIDKPLTVKSGDLTSQGLCFFSGAIKLSQSIEICKEDNSSIIFSIDKPYAPVAKLYINDKEVKVMAWAPYDVDITNFLVQGENKITIELFASNRNLLGPHHHVKGEIFNVGPASFTGKWSWCERNSEAEVATYEEVDRDYWKDGYCFVKFGV